MALPLLVAQGARVAVVAMPGGRPKRSKHPAGAHRPDPPSRTDKRRNLAAANDNSRRWPTMGFTRRAGDNQPGLRGGGGDSGECGDAGEGGGGARGGDGGTVSRGSSSAGKDSSSREQSEGRGIDVDGLSGGQGAGGATANVGGVTRVSTLPVPVGRSL